MTQPTMEMRTDKKEAVEKVARKTRPAFSKQHNKDFQFVPSEPYFRYSLNRLSLFYLLFHRLC